MPRRSFFRAGGDKKNKQERKLQQKIQRQQAQTEPPQNLSGPPQNAPPRLAGHPYDNYVSDVQYHASSTSNTQQSQGNPSSGARRAEGNEDGQIQQKNGEQLPQHYHYQNNNGHLVPTHAAFPNQHHQYEDNVLNQLQQQQQQRQQQIYGQHDPQHNTANQQFPQQHDSSPQNNHRQQQQYEYPQNIVHPESIPQHQNLIQPSQSAQQPPHTGVIITQNIAPTVDSATDEIWRCESDDFRSASHAIQMLRLAIVAEWEQQRIMDREAIESGRSGNYGRASSPRDTRGRNNNNHSNRPSTSTSPFSYDPPETFLCLQGAALRFHARFEAMQAERSAKVDDQKQESERVDRATVVDLYEEKNQQQQSQHFDPMGDHSLEWELTEQAAWEVWEESVRASAALAHACVGPAWRRQLKLRRQLIQEAEIRLHQQPHLQNRSRFRDTDSVGSSVGGVSSTSNISMDFSNPQAGRFLPGPQMTILDTSARTMMPDDLAGSVVIPEVLPAAMIRFAASAIETSVPPLRNASTKIFWEYEKLGISSGGNEPLLNTLGRHLHDERRWLRRRKRLGDTQRDLAFAMFCGGSESENRSGETGESSHVNEWSIPGAHAPVAAMIHSWLETCQTGWPVPKVGEEDTVPFYFEAYSSDLPEFVRSEIDDVTSNRDESKEDDSLVPPVEIVLPADVDPSTSYKSEFSKPNAELHSEASDLKKYSMWEEIVDVSKIDWWYTLLVLRDCSDLASAGWRPPPSGKIGDEIILSLISIAEGGLAGVSHTRQEIPEQQTRKERLVACSCASESLATIKNLATRDVLPRAMVMPLVTSLCHLLSAAETTISAHPNVESVEEHAEDTMFDKEILTQRNFVASNSAEILWVLLSNESTSCPTTDALLDAIDVDLSITKNEKVEDRILAASGAIRALSAALFGDPPTVKGVPMLTIIFPTTTSPTTLPPSKLLRFFWGPVIDLFGRVSSTVFRGDGETAITEDAIADGKKATISLNCSICKKNQFLAVVLEVALALRRLVDSEMVYGTGDLSPKEWESLISALDVGLSPWLVYPSVLEEQSSINAVKENGHYLQQEIYSEVMAIFSQVRSFLTKCSRPEYCGFHLIVDEECRECLHKFLLRKVCPALAENDATSMALAVIKSWCVVGYLPFREGNWCKRAADLLAESNALFDGNHGSLYPGGYVHPPAIRLKALKSLVDDQHELDVSNHSNRDSESSITMTSVSVVSGGLPVLSLFSLTRNVRDLHLVLIHSLLLPQMISILDPSYHEMSMEVTSLPTVFVGKPTVNPKSGVTDRQYVGRTKMNASLVHCFDVIEKEFLLRRYAVGTLGMLFRSITGDSSNRHHFIELLKRVAVSEPHSVNDWIGARVEDDLERKVHLEERFALETCRLQLEAIKQLELCLRAPFSELPHTHGSVPVILRALCNTALFYAMADEKYQSDSGQCMRSLLTLASILPLARLSCTVNGHGIFMPRERVTCIIPEELVSAVSIDEWLHFRLPNMDLDTLPVVSEELDQIADQGDIAPFVFVRQHNAHEKSDYRSSQNNTSLGTERSKRRRNSNRSENGKEGTTIEIEPVASAIKKVLQEFCGTNGVDKVVALLNVSISSRSVADLPSVVRMVCYRAISSFLSHGMTYLASENELHWLELPLTDDICNENELVLRSQTVSVLAGVIGHIYLVSCPEVKEFKSAQQVCKVLIDLSTSKYQKVVKNACCGLVLVISSLCCDVSEKNPKEVSNRANDALPHGCLLSFVEYACSALGETKTGSDHILIPLMNAMREVVICLGSSLPKSIRRRVFLACYNNRHVLWHVQVAVFQCAIAVIDQCVMTPKEVELMLFITSGSIENSPRGGKRFQVLLLDLLRRRLICERLKKMSTGSEINFCKTARVHNKLAREVLSLEKFPVDLEDFDCSKSSAWQCGSTVLTLRIGSKRSLYRGWVEITVRSPSFRFRRLVRWKTENFTENAEILLPFWEQLHTSLENSAAKQPVSHPAKSFEESLDLIESQHDLIDRHDPSQRNDTKSLSNARSIIDRFDQLFDASSVTGSSESEKLNFSSLRSQTEVFSSLRTSNLRHETSDISSDRRSEFGFNPKALKRTLSDGNISESMRLSTHSEQKQKRERNVDCVYSWLKNAVGNLSCDKEIILEFEALGFSSTALGFPLIPSNASMPTSYPSLYSHDVLTPYANGSNFLRSISILDRKTPFQDHKIALFYGGPFRSTKKSKKPDSSANDGNHFLMATQASTDFWEFAKDLGDFVPVRHLKYFSGGLDTSKSSADGSFAIVWFGSQCEDDDAPIAIDSMVIFHTITLMPDGVTNRKRHVGNDMVHVVYGIEIDVDHENLAIGGHFGFVTIYIIPLGKTDMVKISVRLKSGLDETICMALDHVVQDVVVSRRIGASLVRSLATHADLICRSMLEDKLGRALNLEERSTRIADMDRHLISI